ncbi:MAG: alpha/beta fold hydrolase [Desulfobacteraceae bacterium]|nr:MAG: alpha/beta fold hydrolase [Desulfobacteraceae bacterium]
MAPLLHAFSGHQLKLTMTNLESPAMEAEMDHILRSWENGVRGGMQLMGGMYQWFGAAMGMNPCAKPWAAALNNYGKFLTEKSMPIASGHWETSNQVVHCGLKVALRKFNGTEKGNPLLLVPPEAGHNSQIVDYGPGQSLVQCALDHFAGDVYVVDKLPADTEHATYSMDDCIRSLDLCIQHIGKPVHLVGLCQGGWQAAIYTALFTERVKTLTLAGAPIDFHAGDGIISEWAQSLPLSVYQAMVAAGGGCMPGAFIVTGFKMMNAFDRFVGDDVNLYKNINDPKYIERYRRFNKWYQFTQPLGGRMYLEVVKYLFKENRLVKGLLEIMGRRVDLSRIYHPLFLVAGTKDDITPPAQLFAIRKHASSLLIEERLAEAGHIGVFMGNDVIKTIWTDIFQRLSAFTFEDRFDVDLRAFTGALNEETSTP